MAEEISYRRLVLIAGTVKCGFIEQDTLTYVALIQLLRARGGYPIFWCAFWPFS
jgi:hypothetical protein